MKHFFFIYAFLLPLCVCAQNKKVSPAWLTPFERDSTQTTTYDAGIAFYQKLAKAYPSKLKMQVVGTTDIGRPLHTIVLSTDQSFTPELAKKRGKCVVFINNGIHPGEPEGIDASMMLLRDYAQMARTPFLDKLVLVVVPFYNVDGALNRNAFSRANQNGPETHGFRGNAQNLDLNRDFIKCDTRNAASFNQVFTAWQPTLFVDNHTSNGADYTYTMTLIATQTDKLGPILSDYQQNQLLPQLYAAMKDRQFEMTPYVSFDEAPDKGIFAFLEHPRFSTGYAALHQTIGFMPETHMLKPFPARVAATYAFMDVLVKIAAKDAQILLDTRQKALDAVQKQTIFPLQWQADTTRRASVTFKGYASGQKPSAVSGLPRLYYDRNQPYVKEIPYFPYCKPTVSVEKPRAYVVPQAYTKVIERLKWNKVKMQPLAQDTVIEADFYYITDYKSSAYPYEGHHPNTQVKVEVRRLKQTFYKGDYWIEVNQTQNRYIVETLEPQGVDAFFSWNFFDGILNQKEGYSDYVFEETAARLLADNPELQRKLADKRAADAQFAASAAAQLDFIYKNSPYYEPSHRRYPVARVR